MTEETQVPELSDIEKQAQELGWQPKEVFESDPKNEGKVWRSAESFVDRKPLFDKIDQQGRELKELKRALGHLSKQSMEVEKLAYDRALQELKATKLQALQEDDHERVLAVDERIAELKEEVKAKQAAPQQPPEAFQRWVEENDWYVKDKKLRSIADGIGLSLAREGAAPEEIMAQVSSEIKALFPDKFGRTRVPPNPDSGGSRRGGGKDVESMMNPMERRIMDTIVQTGMTKEEYLKQFVATQPERFKGVKL